VGHLPAHRVDRVRRNSTGRSALVDRNRIQLVFQRRFERDDVEPAVLVAISGGNGPGRSG
jgi:hypothetical protein